MSDLQERELYKVNPVHDAQERALAAETICQDILSSSRNRLYLNMRFTGLCPFIPWLSGGYGSASCGNRWH